MKIKFTAAVVAAGAAVFTVYSGQVARKPRPFNRHAVAALERGGEAPRVGESTGEPETEGISGPEQEQYENRAYPDSHVSSARREEALRAFQESERHGPRRTHGWTEVGPFTPKVPDVVTYTGRETLNSGRVTALALEPGCARKGGDDWPKNTDDGDCGLFVGAAGGGIWKTEDALAAHPAWEPSGRGIPSNAIGSILFDPTDRRGKTIYVGTGEPNGSSDSEAGVGLYKSTNRGRTWALVPGSLAVAKDRSIGAIAVDPLDRGHIFIGTAVARHGSSSSNGGRFTPPGAPQVGVYESTNGGASFSLAFTRPADAVDPTSVTGNDFFRGGVTKIEVDRGGLLPSDPTRIYFSVFDYGLYRSAGPGTFEQVFASAGGGTLAASSTSRTEFALARKDGKLRIYLGDLGTGAADFYRVDDAGVPAATLTNGVTNLGWTKLSSSTNGTPGFGSYQFCATQCSYDMFVASPPDRPDTVWVGGSMQYNEIFTATPRSNGRAVQRSTDAGVNFTDMTNDAQAPAPLGQHPDQHAIVFAPTNPDVAIVGSDGGVVRTSGQFVDASGDCATRGLSGANLADCLAWLKTIPTRIYSLNDGLRTLQFQSLSVNPSDPRRDIMGGTQDNGTWVYDGRAPFKKRWFESVGGDGGQSGVNVGNPNIRFHTYYDAQIDVNFNKTDSLGWDWIADRFFIPPGSGEGRSFYIPIIADPKVAGTMFTGLNHVWRTLDNGGPQADLDLHCNEFFGDFSIICGDWEPLGGAPGDLTSGPASDKGGSAGTSYVVATERAAGDNNTLWVGTRRGRVWISKNAAAAAASVTFDRLDTSSQPRRFVSGIAVDPADPNHAYVSFSGYDAYTPTTPGHVFEVKYDPIGHAASWTDLSYAIGDQPITDVALDSETGDLYASADFGVLMLEHGGVSWVPAAGNLPPVAVYGLTIDSHARVLYAATHGRGAWKLRLKDEHDASCGDDDH